MIALRSLNCFLAKAKPFGRMCSMSGLRRSCYISQPLTGVISGKWFSLITINIDRLSEGKLETGRPFEIKCPESVLRDTCVIVVGKNKREEQMSGKSEGDRVAYAL